jgi:hypothetical protein
MPYICLHPVSALTFPLIAKYPTRKKKGLNISVHFVSRFRGYFRGSIFKNVSKSLSLPNIVYKINIFYCANFIQNYF